MVFCTISPFLPSVAIETIYALLWEICHPNDGPVALLHYHRPVGVDAIGLTLVDGLYVQGHESRYQEVSEKKRFSTREKSKYNCLLRACTMATRVTRRGVWRAAPVRLPSPVRLGGTGKKLGVDHAGFPTGQFNFKSHMLWWQRQASLTRNRNVNERHPAVEGTNVPSCIHPLK